MKDRMMIPDDLLPANGVALASICAVIYLNEQGEERWAFGWTEGGSIPLTVGLVRLLEHELLTQAQMQDGP